MNFRNRPARVAAATGAVVVAGAATMLAVAAGTASADEPGRCVQNVNIREEPDAQSRIVALCEAGTKVQLGDERDGWVHIDELGGWASKDFVKPDESSARSDSSSGDHSDGADDGTRRATETAAAHPTATRPGAARTASGSHSSGSHESDSGDGERSSGAGGADDAHSTACWADRQTDRADAPGLGRALAGLARPGQEGRASRAATASQTRDASSPFDPVGSSASLPSAPSSQPALSRTSNARPSPTALTTSRSAPFRASLARPWCRTSPVSSPVSAANPTTTWPG